MKKKPAMPAPFPPEEWDFSGVSDSQMEDVCFWEYARESTTVRWAVSLIVELFEEARSWPTVWEVIRQHTQAPAGPDAPAHYRALQASDGRWRGLAHLAAHDRVFSGPDARPWPAPWQATTGRAVGNVLRSLVKVPVPLRETVWEEAREREIADREQEIARWQEPELDAEAIRKSLKRYGFAPVACCPDPLPGSDPQFRELLRPGLGVQAIRINWRDSTDKEIAAAFVQWLKHKRPKDHPEPKRTGGRPKFSARDGLRSLAYARALKHATPADPVYPGELLADEPESRKHYAHRTRALAHFRKLFPFLPKSEKPLFNRVGVHGPKRGEQP